MTEVTEIFYCNWWSSHCGIDCVLDFCWYSNITSLSTSEVAGRGVL